MDISKKDWKLFRERLSDWQENYVEGLGKEYSNFLNDDKKSASEKFWDIVHLIRLKVIIYDDLSDFSDELQLEVKSISLSENLTLPSI